MIYCPARLAISLALLALSQHLLVVQSVIDPVNYTIIIQPTFYHFMHKVCVVWVLDLFVLGSIPQLVFSALNCRKTDF